jgi:hypothetical protein
MADKAETMLLVAQPTSSPMPSGLTSSMCSTARGPASHVEACVVSVTAVCPALSRCHAVTLVFEHPFVDAPDCIAAQKEAQPSAIVERESATQVSVGIATQDALSSAPFMAIVLCRAKGSAP